MSVRTVPSTLLPALSLLMALASPAAAQTAEDYFADGNRLFRDDLYFAALLRYRQAEESGLDTPRLHFNTGVAHYRAGQYQRARVSLEKSLVSAELEPLAQYNLGLNAWQAGSTDEARRRLRLAATQSRQARVADLAMTALAELERRQVEPDTPTAEYAQAPVEEDRRPATLDVQATIGFGNNSNVYMSPASDYVDFGDPAQPTVSPTVVSGAYMPVDVKLRYNINSQRFENFYIAYHAEAEIYQDKELDNANVFAHEFSFGNWFTRERNGVATSVYSAFEIAQYEQTYFDPDDGLERDVDGISIADRLNYRRYGPVIKLRRKGEKLTLAAHAIAQLRNYEDIEAAPEYDHEYFSLSLQGQYLFTQGSMLRVDIGGFSRRYGDRPSFDLDGEQRIANPGVRYDYLQFGLTARQRLGRRLWFGVGFELTDRSDGYLAYNDYQRNRFIVESEWNPSSRIRLRGRVSYSLYDFPNAFAFNNDALNRRTLETAQGSLRGEWRLTRGLSLVGEWRARDIVSNDARIQHEQSRFMLSVEWRNGR